MGLVSIHAPWEGCDVAVVLATRMGMPFQFTHPGKGATGEQSASTLSITSFNSRTLGRVRQLGEWRPGQVNGSFNSRTLGRVRLILTLELSGGEFVSIHAPWEGCDVSKQVVTEMTRVSIHAPWEGCDFTCMATLTDTLRFQFTHPGKGATA